MVSRDGRLVQKGHQRFSFKIIPQHNRKMLILALLVTRCIRYLSVWLSGLAVCTLYTLINGFTGLGDLSHVPPCFFWDYIMLYPIFGRFKSHSPFPSGGSCRVKQRPFSGRQRADSVPLEGDMMETEWDRN